MSLRSILCVQRTCGSQFCPSVWVPEIKLRLPALAGSSFEYRFSRPLLLLFNTTTGAGKTAQLLKTLAALVSQAFAWCYTDISNSGSGDLTLFWLAWNQARTWQTDTCEGNSHTQPYTTIHNKWEKPKQNHNYSFLLLYFELFNLNSHISGRKRIIIWLDQGTTFS